MIRTKGIGKDSTFYIELRIKRKVKKRPVIRELNIEQLSESPKRIEFLFKLFKHRANLRSEKEKKN
jgi:hypothetical protein